MSRSIKKGPYVDANVQKRVDAQIASGSKAPITTWARDCTIVPEFVGCNFLVHNGRQFMRLYVTEDMVGHKLGEFAPTRIFKGHSGRKAAEAGAAVAPAAGGRAPGAPGAAPPASAPAPAKG